MSKKRREKLWFHYFFRKKISIFLVCSFSFLILIICILCIPLKRRETVRYENFPMFIQRNLPISSFSCFHLFPWVLRLKGALKVSRCGWDKKIDFFLFSKKKLKWNTLHTGHNYLALREREALVSHFIVCASLSAILGT